MRQNPIALIVSIASLAMTGLCCITGIGFAAFSSYMRTREIAPAPVYAPPPTPYIPPPTATPPPRPTTTATATGTLSIGPDNPTRGPAGAPITIHVVSDYQCPFCARVEPTLAQLDANNPGQIRWVWHDYPLAFHQNAMPAAEAAREVRRQLGDEAFWRFHDMLFENSRDLSMPTLERLAQAMPGLDLGAFRRAVSGHTHQAGIQVDMATVDAQLSAGAGTPQFLINGVWLRGAQPISAFQTAVEDARARPSR